MNLWLMPGHVRWTIIKLMLCEHMQPTPMRHGGSNAKFTELFRTAPAWLLNFTSMWIDACFLEFDLPCECKITRVGDEQLRAWPLLPTGTMADGDPIPRGEKPMFPFPLDMNR